MGYPRIDEQRRAAILAAVREPAGRSRAAIAREFECSTRTVQRIADEAGITNPWSTADTRKATAAARDHLKARRAALSARFLDEAEKLLDRMTGPFVVFAFGGRDNEFNSAVLADVPTADRTAIVTAEDQAGYAFEVIAAKLDDPSRSSARSFAAAHRARAETWASQWGLDGTATDPRRATYALPAGLDDPATARALAQRLEVGLTTTYASAVADSARAARPELIAALLAAAADAATWGVPTSAFPGLPERVG